ncbi:MAG: ADP-ribosylglycohydrolase family protein [Verrucomicrobia bacterium]|nr:ADP-ribosylglycohydrolase family protein [Verrucomicrobiota bacterium]
MKVIPAAIRFAAIAVCFGDALFVADVRSGSLGKTFTISRADYEDRVRAVWTAQIVAVLLDWPFEHQTASMVWVDRYPRPWTTAPVDDDWYYEMTALGGFERYGIGMTVEQLGEQWKEHSCGSWGSSEQARLLLERGIKPPHTGHPRHNRLWFTIGPQFSSDLYGALAPGLPNLAGRLARELGHINGYAEGTDGAVFMAGMISLAFVEKDSKAIVRNAARLVHPDSPYRQCLDMIVGLADQGRSFEEIANAVEDRWHLEYPATNNAVANGGLVALCVWFGEGDFLKTVNLAARAADFTDADCNAANAAAVVGAMHGMKCLPPHLVAPLGDRIAGERMGPVKFRQPVEVKISDLAKRTAAIGTTFLLANGAKLADEVLNIPAQEPMTQPAELFRLADLTQFWNPEWTLERAGFGGAGGGMAGIRGITYLEGEVLATYPRDEVRGVVLRRTVKLGENPFLSFQAGADAGRAWELNVYANNKLMEKRVIEGGTQDRKWEEIQVDLSSVAGQTVHLRLYQRVLVPKRVAGNAYWKALRVW